MGSKETIGFIGIGRMGFPMAGHLARAGYRVLAHDTNAEAVAGFHAAHGGEPAEDLRALGTRADVVITMLPTSAIVRAVMLGQDGAPGLADHLRPGVTLIDMSTSDPHDTRALGAALSERQIGMIDAPVAGGVVFAKDGTLDILTGGEAALMERLRPILLAMGRSVVHCGPLGAAHALKALNNYVNAAVLAVNLEALVAGRKFGIDLNVMLASMEAATMGRNHPFEKKVKPQVLTRAFASGMAMGLIAKDVGIARSLIAKQGLRGPLAEQVEAVWRQAADELGFDRDQTEIARYWEAPAGLALSRPASDSDAA